MTWAAQELETLNLGDPRRERRYIQLLDKAYQDSTASIAKLGSNYHQSKAFYRLLSNQHLTTQAILDAHGEKIHQRISKQQTVLCIQDTTEILAGKPSAKGIGRLNYDARKGYYTHSTLITDTQGIPLGIYDNWLWARKPKDELNVKESKRWTEGYQRICELSEQHPSTNHLYVGDRESDVMEIIEHGHRHQHPADYLLRARHNRVLKDGGKLFDVKEEHKVGALQFALPTRKGVQGRQVTQTIYLKRAILKDGIAITIIISKELNPPKGTKAVEWKLITNREVTGVEQAAQLIDWYRKRWQIEVLFHVLKTGCKVEDRQFGSIETQERALLVYLLVSYRILLMTMLARVLPDASCEVIFSKLEWQTAYRVKYRKTPPHKPITLSEMVRLVAGFGGFLNRKSDKEPGVKTMWLGLRSLADYTIGAICG